MEVQILGVNQVGHESGNDAACEGKNLPWLQEFQNQMVWENWQVNYRDVIILDGNNVHLETYNLTQNNLSETANFNQLKSMLIQFSTDPESR